MYDFPNRIKYSVFFDAGGNGDLEYAIRGPRGKAGRLYDWGLEGITEAYTSGEGSVAVGTTADPDAYGEEWATSGLAAEDASSPRASLLPKGVPVSTASTDLGDYLINGLIPADNTSGAKVLMTVVDTTAAGMGTYFMIIDWQD